METIDQIIFMLSDEGEYFFQYNILPMSEMVIAEVLPVTPF